MVKFGEHITLDFLGVTKVYTPDFFKDIVNKIAKATNVEILNISQHVFKSQGFTLIALLAESHMSFHTFPEKGIISFDFYTCGTTPPTAALDILKKEIGHERIVTRKFDRSTIGYKEDICNTPGQKNYYVVNNVLEDFVSKENQHIEILDLAEYGKSLFIDNEIQVSESDEHLYSTTMVEASSRLHSVNSNIAVIGGGDGGLVRECLEQGYGHIDWYELDPEVVGVCEKHLSKIGTKDTKSVNRIWGDAFESIKKIKDRKYDKIFVDLNDDSKCINLAIRNMKNLKRILKLDGVITTQVGSQDRAPKQVDKWLDVFYKHFENVGNVARFIPSFDCSWNFVTVKGIKYE